MKDMLKLIKSNDKYVLKAKRFLDREDFLLLNQSLKMLFLFYNKECSGWIMPKNQILEKISYIEKKLGYSVDYDKNLVLEEEKEVEIETKFERKVSFDESVLNVKLFEYQKRDVIWALQRSRFFLASDPGIGKTIETIAVISQWLKQNKIDSVFIIVKNQLVYHWKYEVVLYSNVIKEEDIDIINNKNKKDFFNEERKKVIICPNHLLKDVFEYYKEEIDLKKKWKKEKPCLIIDESHEFKNSNAKKTNSLLKIIKNFDYRILLSATPAINGFEDWYMQMKILDSSIIPMSEYDFKLDIADSIGTEYDPWKIVSYNNERKLFYLDKFKKWVRKVRKEDLKEKTTKQFVKPIYLQMSDKHASLYELIRSLYLKKYEKENNGMVKISDIRNKYPYLVLSLENPNFLKGKILEDNEFFQPLTKILSSWNNNDNVKFQYLDEFLKEKIEIEKEKVIVFDNHPITLNELEERYKRYSPLVLHGERKLTLEEKEKMKNLFNDIDSEHKLFLSNPQIGGTGLNLNKACNTIIFLTTPMDTLLVRQAMDRTDRINSLKDSTVYFLIFGGTIDQRIMKITLKRIYENDNSFKEDFVYI